LNFPSGDREFPVCSALELQRGFQAGRLICPGIFESIDIRNIRERVVPDRRSVTLLCAEQRPRLPLALNDVVPNADGLEITA